MRKWVSQGHLPTLPLWLLPGPQKPAPSGRSSETPTLLPFLHPDSCQVRVNRTVLRHGDCEALVNVTFCEGSCPGVSK